MNTDDLLVNPEIKHEIVQRKIRENLPWIIGAATVIAGTLLIRAWNRDNKEQEHDEPGQHENSSDGINFKSVAAQLLPLATLFFKNWLKKDAPEKEAVTV